MDPIKVMKEIPWLAIIDILKFLGITSTITLSYYISKVSNWMGGVFITIVCIIGYTGWIMTYTKYRNLNKYIKNLDDEIIKIRQEPKYITMYGIFWTYPNFQAVCPKHKLPMSADITSPYHGKYSCVDCPNHIYALEYMGKPISAERAVTWMHEWNNSLTGKSTENNLPPH